MFSTSDTIVAIATPPGRGGVGVVRLSGPGAREIAGHLITHNGALEPRHATLTRAIQLTPDTHEARLRPDVTYVSRSASRADCSHACGSARPSASQADFSNSYAVSGLGRAEAIDQVVATYFPAPASYTGDDVVELSAHGSPVVLRAILTSAIAFGARLAEPGEFTLRAFLNSRIDLVQAEAVADLIDAVTPLQARAAFDQLQGTLTRAVGEIDAALFDLIARLEASIDFPEQGYHFIEPAAVATAVDALVARTTVLLAGARQGRLVREGLQIAIVGKPNVGKSSVFNALVGTSRAIVTDVPGTTRDLVTEVIDLGGLRVTLVDTAGLRQARDIVEAEGIERARQAQAVSDLILVVLDGSVALEDDDTMSLQATDSKILTVINKADLRPAWQDPNLLRVSAKSLAGLQELRERLVAALDIEPLSDRPEITNVRHIALIQRAHEALLRGREAAFAQGGSLSEEFVLADLQMARASLEEISGRRTSDDVLAHIFSRFCIGK